MRTLLSHLILIAFFAASCAKSVDVVNAKQDTELNADHFVDIWKAKEQLEEYLLDIETKSNEFSRSRKISNCFSTGSPVVTKAGAAINPFVHIFNFENDEGYAIMSTDDRIPPLIALILYGNFAENTIVDNPGLATFLAGAERYYIRKIEDRNNFVDGEEHGGHVEYGPRRNTYFTDRFAHCTVQWGQRDPYNRLCPIIRDTLAPCGCVATAVAQLMSIYEYPNSNNGYVYDWDEMTEHVNSRYQRYPPAYNQISRLMQQLGLNNNLNMSYGARGSGASIQNIPRTLRNFGYSSGGTLNSYNSRAVIDELRSGHPVILSGFDFRTLQIKKFLGIEISREYIYPDPGHCWLAHGLMQSDRNMKTYNGSGILIGQTIDTEYYILCNYGWDGVDDGYYLSGAFDTSDGPDFDPETRAVINQREGTEYNFRYNLQSITGIRKEQIWGA